MDFYNLKAIFAARKTAFSMLAPSDSFRVAAKRYHPYIKPEFAKIEFASERPSIILISAVGATGKTTLAEVLSSETGMPLLDLGKHKPVGDNTLRGLLTSAFDVKDLSGVFEGIAKGTFGVIIDGIDEGRSKTNENAFDAFLDDLAKLCAGSPSTSLVLLGRTQILEECWLYLTDRGVSTGLISISPFDLESARNYIDEFTKELESNHAEQYRIARDSILAKLAGAFEKNVGNSPTDFISFIGYPPVLDAIVTLLQKERNFHKLQQMLESANATAVETTLLSRIGAYVARREREQKVLTNIVQPLIADLPLAEREFIVSKVFEAEEQYMRLVSYCIGKPLTFAEIPRPLINTQYEEKILEWIPEHPFIAGRQFRNAVFEAIALSTLMSSSNVDAHQLVLEYYESHRYNYYVVYMLDLIAPDRGVPIHCLSALLGCALEFQSSTSAVELRVDSADWEIGGDEEVSKAIDIQIEIVMGADGETSKTISFRSELNDATPIRLGHRFSATFVAVPCEIALGGAQELELTAPMAIFASKINLQAASLVLKHHPKSSEQNYVLLEADIVESSVTKATINGVGLVIATDAHNNLAYPLVQYARVREKFSSDPSLKRKYLKLRKILLHFRSHSRGTMAKYKEKVDNERVAGNELGQAILNKLLQDQILTLDGNFYFLQPLNVDKHLGVSCIDLQKGFTSDKLQQYLAAIPETAVR
jgi:hypothetical protein